MADKDVLKAIEDHVKGRVTALFDAHDEVMDKAEGTKEAALAAFLLELAASFRTEADLWTRSKSKGCQGTSTQLRQVASRVAGVAVDIQKLRAAFDESRTHPSVAEYIAQNPETPAPAPTSDFNLSPVPPGEFVPGFDPMPPPSTVVPGNPDVEAYLRGDTDVIPPLAPDPLPTTATSTIISPNGHEATPAGPLQEEARTMTQTFSLPTGIGGDPFSEPRSIESQIKRPSTYVPTGGRRYTFADLMAPPNPANVPQHWSWSQLQASEGCGVQYRGTRIDNLTQIPQWSNIGGDAFHTATEEIERLCTLNGPGAAYPTDSAFAAKLWDKHFAAAISEVASTSPVPIGQWRVSAGGKENQDWWRVEGEAMLQRFVEQRAKLAAEANPRTIVTLPHAASGTAPAIEWGFTITVPGPMGDLTFTNIIDRVWQCSDGSLLIEDLKSGSRMPNDTGQLGSYAWGVVMATGLTDRENMHIQPRIMGTFYNARKGIWTPAVNLLAAHPWDEFVFRLHAAEAKRRAGLYTPHVTDLCVACSVAYACPLRNREGGA
jgi:hypothetical protein